MEPIPSSLFDVVAARQLASRCRNVAGVTLCSLCRVDCSVAQATVVPIPPSLCLNPFFPTYFVRDAQRFCTIDSNTNIAVLCGRDTCIMDALDLAWLFDDQDFAIFLLMAAPTSAHHFYPSSSEAFSTSASSSDEMSD